MILRSLELDATAIKNTDLPMEAVQQEATQMQKSVEELALALASDSAEVAMVEVAMRAHVAHLIVEANAPDRFTSAGAAVDLLNDITQLRNLTGLPR